MVRSREKNSSGDSRRDEVYVFISEWFGKVSAVPQHST